MSASVRILFVGNSYTSRNDLPRLVSELAAAAPLPRQVHTQAIVAGGASLKRHWNAGKVQAALAAEPWDYVVLQEQSTLPYKNPQRYHDNVRLFQPEIARHGARTVLYLTWSRHQTPERQDEITRAVEVIGAEVGALIVPVGPAWHLAMNRDPSIALYVADGSHPSAAGSYLAACVFVTALFGGLPEGWSVPDSLKLDRGTAERLHVVASDVLVHR
ncbi:MAG TPA: SGNH/GDSL hydrolase family protein [Casimicrobiaceae bacterium]|nr:SGNH/GDSL hydrolase family protein [Casimicrobiaceae bacterium]